MAAETHTVVGVACTAEELRALCDPDTARREQNEKAGHSLCEHCNGTGNELYAMYRSCRECGGDGIAVKYGEMSALGRWWAERRDRIERKRLARKYAPPRDWKVEIAWRLSRWLGIGHCFSDRRDRCRHCDAMPSDIDFEFRRVGPFRSECLDREMCREAAEETRAATLDEGTNHDH